MFEFEKQIVLLKTQCTYHNPPDPSPLSLKCFLKLTAVLRILRHLQSFLKKQVFPKGENLPQSSGSSATFNASLKNRYFLKESCIV